MPTIVLPSIEAIVIAYIHARTEVTDLVPADRIRTRTPADTGSPWIRIDTAPGRTPPSRARWFAARRLTINAWGGDGDQAAAQIDANTAIRTCEAVLAEADRYTHDGAVITATTFVNDPWRLPDQDFDPARERYLFDLVVYIHPA